MPRLRWEIEEGEPKTLAGWDVIPIARKLSFSWLTSSRWGVSWAWIKPVRIRAGREGQFQDVKVPDPTLKALAFLTALALAGPLAYGVLCGVKRWRSTPSFQEGRDG